MAVTQVSRIQVRRGLQQDLPQLASAELGWSVDTQKLFIGNGTLEEGAPIIGVTEILTSKSIGSIASVLGTYTFIGNVAGVAAQTGSSPISPTVRSFQQKLDDFVNVKDFGAVGNGITDDTIAINRAIQQIYRSDVAEVDPRTRRTLYFPAGKYLISSEIFIPPFTKIVGDGMANAIIEQVNGNRSVLSFSDSKFQTGVNLGVGAILPRYIEINGLKLSNSNASVQASLLKIDSATNVRVHSTTIEGTAGSAATLVDVSASAADAAHIVFDSCCFLKGGNAIVIGSGSIRSVSVSHSAFDVIANSAVNLGSSIGFTSLNNYYGAVGSTINTATGSYLYSFGDTHFSDNSVKAGLRIGNLLLTNSRTIELSPIPSVISLVPNTAATLTYQISNSSARRFGTYSYNTDGVTTIVSDEYTENVTLDVNIFANADSIICSTNLGTAKLEFNYKLFTN